MYLLTFAQISFVDAIEQLLPHLGGDRFDPLDQRASRSAQGDELGPTVAGGRFAMHQPLRFETVQQSRQRWPLDCHALCKLALCRVVIESGKVQKHQPASLGQAKIGEPTIQFSAPATRELCQLHREAVLVGIHGTVFPEKLIISELTTAPE